MVWFLVSLHPADRPQNPDAVTPRVLEETKSLECLLLGLFNEPQPGWAPLKTQAEDMIMCPRLEHAGSTSLPSAHSERHQKIQK